MDRHTMSAQARIGAPACGRSLGRGSWTKHQNEAVSNRRRDPPIAGRYQMACMSQQPASAAANANPSRRHPIVSDRRMAPLQAAQRSMGDEGDAGLGGIDLTEVDTTSNWPQSQTPHGGDDTLHSAVVEMPSEPHSIMGWLEALPSHLTAGGA